MSYYLLDYNPGTQQWGYPRRGGAKLSGTVIMHTAECLADNIGEDTSAEGCANMIANRADWGSYHCLCDSDSIIKMAPWEYEVWGDTETNNWAVHISAALRTVDWLTMPADRRDRVYRNLAQCAAEFVVYMATKGVTVPLRRITGAEARARVPGFCAHGDSGIARTDPGAAFDWALFFAYTQEAISNGGISPQGSIQEDDVLEEADRKLFKEFLDDYFINVRRFEGNRNLFDAVNQTRTDVLSTKEIAAAIPQQVLFENRVDGRNLIDWFKQTRADIISIAPGGAVDIPQLAKALSEQLDARDVAALAAQLQITVKEG